jgi:hypothetical protein
VNCFSPGGECSRTFNLNKYPQIVIHTRSGGFFSYTGPFEFDYLSSYLNAMQAPIKRIDSMNEFIEFILLNDVAIIGHFNFSKQSHNKLYKIFYESSLKCLSLDFENSVRFIVITNKTLWSDILKFQHQTTSSSNIVAFSSFGVQKVFRDYQNLTADYLTLWIHSNLKRVIIFIFFLNINSLLIIIIQFI